MQYAIVDFAKNVDSLLHTIMAIESDVWPAGRPTRTESQTVNTSLSRHYFGVFIKPLGLAMPNCLADNITGHSCDPYGRLRDRRLYFFMLRTF